MNMSRLFTGFTIAVLAGVALSACKVRMPTVGTMPPSRSNGQPEQIPTVSVPKDTSAQLVSASLMTAARNIDPEVTNTMLEQGKTIYQGACVKCHAFKDAKQFTPERWEKVLTAMAPKARLTEDQTRSLRVYTLAYQKL